MRTDALSESGGASGRARDHRLLLLYDGDVLAGVAAHRLTDQPKAAVRPGREILFIAVRTELRGELLEDGTRASDRILSEVLGDAVDREPQLTHLGAAVHTDNRRSRAFLVRHGALIDPAVSDVHPVLIPVAGKSRQVGFDINSDDWPVHPRE